MGHRATYRCTRAIGDTGSGVGEAIIAGLKDLPSIFDPDDEYELLSLQVFDPEQRSDEPITKIEGEELKQVNFLTTRAVARKPLQEVIDGKNNKSWSLWPAKKH